MVFPSLFGQVDSGVIPLISTWVVLIFSFFLSRWKKLAILVLVLFTFLGIKTSFALMAAPSNPGVQYPNIYNTMYPYYGNVYGPYKPYYSYPRMPYHAFYGPTPYYFQGPQYSYFNQSPYRPFYMQDCPYCGPRGIQQIPMGFR